jgi:hypothetical protein
MFFLVLVAALSYMRVATGSGDPEGPFADGFYFFHTKLRRATGETGGVGLYYDKYELTTGGAGDGGLIAVGSTGFGMISVCIGDALGLIPREESVRLTLETLDSLLGEREGFKPKRSNHTGFFGHFLNPETGDSQSEISTIDTALMAAGAMFARNYLKDPTVQQKTNLLVRGIEWGAAIGADNYMAMVMNPDTGKPDWSKKTHPFNEYYVLACVGMVVEKEMNQTNGSATAYFNRYCTNPPQSMEDAGAVSMPYGQFNTWSDYQGHFASSFQVQFCYYLSKFFQTFPAYNTLMTQSAGADWLYFKNVSGDKNLGTKSAPYQQWGCGAGAYPGHGGYYAASIDNNDELVYSAPIIAGFFPADKNISQLERSFVPVETTLQELYDNDVCTYSIDGRKVLWRCSLKLKEWRAPTIESVDFSTFLLGYAWHLVGPQFFSDNAI